MGPLFTQPRPEAAIEVLERALGICRRSLPEDHWLAASVTSGLGISQMQLKRFDLAGPLLEAGYRGLLNARGADNGQTREARARLQEYYRQTNQAEAAAAL